MDFENGSILYQSKLFDIQLYDVHGRPLVCADSLTDNTGLFPKLQGITELTYISCSLSLFGATAVLFTYAIFRELQTFPGLVLMNLCLAVLATNSVFLLGGPILQHLPLTSICTSVAILLHFFYLSYFSWMSIFSFEMTKSMYQARRLVQESKVKRQKLFIVYVTIGWLLPLVTSIVSIVLNFTTGLVRYGTNSRGEIGQCWINHYLSFMFLFMLPLVLSLSCNIIFLVITTIFLCRAYRDQTKVNKSNIYTMIRVWLALFTITGLTWISGFLAIWDAVPWMWYIFSIVNGTQGFGIFLTFIFTKKVYNLYANLIKKHVLRNIHFTTSKSKTLNSSIQ